MSGSTVTQLHTDTTAICSGTTQPETCTTTFNAMLPIGQVSFEVTLNYVDQNSAAKSLAPVSTALPTVVNADAPSGLSVTVN